MPESPKPSTHTRTSTRRPGNSMTKVEREKAKETFLQSYALNGNILLSCRRANIDRSTFHDWCEKDEVFSIKWHQAERDFADIVLAELVKRAVTGYERPMVSMGRIVYRDEDRTEPLMERIVSDTLLAMLVKKHFPEFRDKQQIEVSGKDGGAINIETQWGTSKVHVENEE